MILKRLRWSVGFLTPVLAAVSLWLCCSSALSQPVVAIGQSFTAATLGVDSDAIPPDAGGTVGPLHYVELINGRFSVFDKSSGNRVLTMTDLAFWAQAGVTFRSGWDVTDPRIIFDPVSQRWFASQVDFEPTGTINTNRFLLAISATANPTGSWHAVAFWADPTANNFADFPTLGLDSTNIYLSGDLFDELLNPVGPTLVCIPKASLLTSSPTTNGMTWFGVLDYAVNGELLQPAICFDGSGQGNVLAVDTVAVGSSDNLIVHFDVKTSGGQAKATLGNSSFIKVPSYIAPSSIAQPDGSHNLDGGDARFSAAVYEIGGVLYATHSTVINNRAAIRWYRIDRATQNVLEAGTLSDPAMDLYYPSIAANAVGTVVIGFNGSSSTRFPSSFAVVGTTANAVTTFSQPLLLKAGSASYQNLDSGGFNRWGDYSATCVDPADPSRFWTIEEIATGAKTWSTQVTELLTGTPVLSVASTGSQLSLSWFGTLFTLQSSDSLANPGWNTVNQSFSTNNGVVTAQLPLSASQGFFRLQAP